MTFAVVVWMLVGLFLVGAGVAQGVKAGRLGRDGRRTVGSVVRIDETGSGRAPVIAWPDEAGVWHEFTVGLKAFRPIHPVGAQVPVLFRAGRPDSAHLGSARHHLLMIGVPMLVGVAAVAAGVWSIE